MQFDFRPEDFELAADGLMFPEGPVALADGSILVVEIEGGSVARIAPDGAVRRYPVARGPNGMALGPDGAAYVCCDGGLVFATSETGIRYPTALGDNYVGGEIQRLDLQAGTVETIFTHVGEDHIGSLNDIVFDETGGCYVVDTSLGKLYYANMAARTIELAAEDLVSPNGMGLSPDGRTLYVSETFTGHVQRFEVTAPGRLANKSCHYQANGEHPLGLNGEPGYDGLCIDAAGNVCVANLGGSGITVIGPDGSRRGMITVPDHDPYVTNMCFAPPDFRTAFICSSGRGRLYRLRWPEPGLELHFSGFDAGRVG